MKYWIKQGKSEGFHSCDWRSNLAKVGVKLAIFFQHMYFKSFLFEMCYPTLLYGPILLVILRNVPPYFVIYHSSVI